MDQFRAAEGRESSMWSRSKVPGRAELETLPKAVVDSRRAPTWKLVDGRRVVEARLAPGGYQGPDPKARPLGTPGCVGLWPSHLQVVLKSALRKWKLRSLEFRSAFSQEDGFTSEV